LTEECARAKRLLDEKYMEAGRLREESVVKGDQCADLRGQVAQCDRDIEAVKAQRAEMLREIHHLKELNDQKTREACGQSDQLKGLDTEIHRTQARIEDTTRLVDARSADLRTKQLALEDTERELARVRDLNAKLNADCANMRRSNECTAAENYDLRKEVEFTTGRNADLGVSIRDTECRLKEREDALFVTRKDIDGQRVIAGQASNDNADLSNEMAALEKHSQVLNVQNHDLTGELDRFCKTDEVLRRQLDRRHQVNDTISKTRDELRFSYHRVEEARSRSPTRSPVKRI